MPPPAITSGVLLIGLAAAGLAAPALVPRLGDAMARRLGSVAALLPAPGRAASALETDTDPTPRPLAPAPDAALRRDPGPGRSPAGRTGDAIDIPADRLARLTEKQLRGIGATDAIDSGGRAAGARLRGVGRLGLGLVDGDVVTSLDGRATPGAGPATAAALAAYASGEPTVRATVVREGRTLRVTAHVPSRAGHGD